MAQPKLHVRVKPSAESIVRHGHPWVFDESIQSTNRPGELGELAILYDRQDRFLAAGFFDPHSPIRVRLFHAGKPANFDEAWWKNRLQAAFQRRDSLFGPETNGFRYLYGESEGFPGLVVDRYGDNLVLKAYSAIWKPRLEWLVNLVRELLNPARVVLRLSKNVQEKFGGAGLADGQLLWGPPLEGPVTFLENGLTFAADLVHGQKTGFFLDQRENRAEVGRWASGRTVLNAFSFSGGFSLYAARGGAVSVTDLDISEHALKASRRHFEMNRSSLAPNCRHETIQADVFEWFKENRRQRRYDMVVIDPPTLARKKVEKSGALHAYQRLLESGLEMTKPGGILVAASCTAHVTAEEYFDLVEREARKTGRPFSILKKTQHPPDHPVNFAEAAYLKAIFVQLTAPPGRRSARLDHG